MLVPLGIATTVAGRQPGELHTAVQATLAYLGIYVVMNLGAFACVAAVVRRTPRGAIEDFRGLARRSPVLAVCFALFLTALAGLPPGVAGLFAKLVVLRAAVHGHVAWLAVIAAVNTVIGLAYYLRVAALLFDSADVSATTTPATSEPPSRTFPARTVSAAVAIAVIGTVALSIDPQPLLHAASTAAESLRRTVAP
jgi:NADH-quinone oxidoreductase subunit N